MNRKELQDELYRLRHLEEEQLSALATQLDSPRAIFSSALSLFPKSNTAGGESSHQGYARLIARFLIPLILNKTLFRHSNFLIKLAVGLASQKVSKYVTKGSLEHVIDKAKSLIGTLFNHQETSKINKLKPVV